MKKKFLFQLALCSTILMTSSCEDDDDGLRKAGGSSPVIQTNATSSNFVDRDFGWSDYSYTVDGNVRATFNNIPDCSKDDYFRLVSNGTFIVNEGLTKCDPSDPQQTSSSTWELSSDNSQLILNDPRSTSPEFHDILVNNGSILKLRITELQDDDLDGVNEIHVSTITLKKL